MAFAVSSLETAGGGTRKFTESDAVAVPPEFVAPIVIVVCPGTRVEPLMTPVSTFRERPEGKPLAENEVGD